MSPAAVGNAARRRWWNRAIVFSVDHQDGPRVTTAHILWNVDPAKFTPPQVGIFRFLRHQTRVFQAGHQMGGLREPVVDVGRCTRQYQTCDLWNDRSDACCDRAAKACAEQPNTARVGIRGGGAHHFAQGFDPGIKAERRAAPRLARHEAKPGAPAKTVVKPFR